MFEKANRYFQYSISKTRSKTKTKFLRYFQTWESEGEIFVVILKKWKSEKPILTWSRRDAKVKKIKKSEKVKPKVNHFLKASETPKCIFPHPCCSPKDAELAVKLDVDGRKLRVTGKNPTENKTIRHHFKQGFILNKASF